MRVGKALRVAAMTFALAMAVTPALVDYADAGRGGGRGGGGGHGMRGGGGGHAMRGGGGGGRHYGGGGNRHYGGGGNRHYGGSGNRHYGGAGNRHYGSGKNYSHGQVHRYYRRGHGYGYWRGGVWIATGIVGYGAGSYCSRLYYYNYSRWLYECQ
jgi:hypothetical protein